MLDYEKKLKTLSRNLRRDMTDAERVLWSRLRRGQILGVRFYRQKPLADFIVDFYCAAANLVIEVDGSQHFEEAGQQADQSRTQKLESLGLMVMRFDNLQVLREIDAVVEAIASVVERRKSPSIPLFQRGKF